MSRNNAPGHSGGHSKRPLNRVNCPPRFKPQKVAVKQVTDAHHPRGFREECNDRELSRRKSLLISQNRFNGTLLCGYDNGNILDGYCGEPLTEYSRVELCHKTPKGYGGATHDDHFDNLFLGCHACNFRNGSRRVA
jgi:hypothetical protein